MPQQRLSKLRSALLLCSAGLIMPGCSSLPLPGPPPEVKATAPTAEVVTLSGESAAELSVQASQAVWTSSPAAIVGGPGDGAQVVAKAAELGLPAFQLVAQAADASLAPENALVAEELKRLGVDAVLAIGAVGSGSLQGIKVVTADGDLPERTRVTPIAGTALLRAPSATTDAAAVAVASLTAAGAQTIELSTPDPRAAKADVKAIAASGAEHFVAVGRKFGSANKITTRLSAAATGAQLPGGGQTVFTGKRYVAIYGHPSGPALGLLGEQSPEKSVTRVKALAKKYQPYTEDQFIPAFEIIATVASGAKGDDGNYSNEWGVDVLQPYIDAARENGVYVVLDLQPGRADFLDQAKQYEELLKDPAVGLAMDPEWKLTKDQKPMVQIGTVQVAEVNRVITWLADLTRDNHLPQKMLLLHQFRPDMITGREDLDMSRDELGYVAQMDGNGPLGAKISTWNAVREDSPKGLRWGWKNFIDEDAPTPTAAQTMAIVPKPYWVSYQ
ncbi:MAG: hypothetical protein ACOYEV_04040 [Candidatus Nanopelagicales bacterium]